MLGSQQGVNQSPDNLFSQKQFRMIKISLTANRETINFPLLSLSHDTSSFKFTAREYRPFMDQASSSRT
jgi:hypothetical protein